MHRWNINSAPAIKERPSRVGQCGDWIINNFLVFDSLQPFTTIVRLAAYRRRLQFTVRGGGAGRKLSWPSVRLTPAASHGDGLSCVPHASTAAHSNTSDVSVQAVSFIIVLK
jgi:hypothetical protein